MTETNREEQLKKQIEQLKNWRKMAQFRRIKQFLTTRKLTRDIAHIY